MLIAKDQEGCLITGAAYRQTGKEKEQRALVCPGCGKGVIFKNGNEKIPHFAHRANHECYTFSEGESSEHLAGKELLQRILPPEACLEAYLPELSQRPDLLWRRLAVEFQCSALSAQRLQERTENYLAQGYDPWWILGRHFLPEKGLRWSQVAKAVVRDSPQGLELWGLNTSKESLLHYHELDWHYQEGTLFSVTEHGVGKALFAGLFHPGELRRKRKVQPKWRIAEYRLQIQRWLLVRSKRVLRLQGCCYERGGNLLALPDWCYLPGSCQFLLEQQLVYLRFLFLLDPEASFAAWYLEASQVVEWPFLLLDKKAVLEEVFHECRRLWQAI